jgi:amino acid adenylation domain-containing protein
MGDDVKTADPPFSGNIPLPSRHSGPFVEFARSEIEKTLDGRFARVATAFPENFAVTTRSERLTYRELNALANRVAHAIVAFRGAKTEPVALLFRQGVPSVIAVLGALKAGKIYVPLDPYLPKESLERMLKDSGARLLVTESRNLPLAQDIGGSMPDLLDVDRIGPDASEQDPGLTGSPGALAYVYYTSGSTGAPKGVMDTHRNVLHNIMRYTNRLRICADDRLTLLQPFGFSGAVSSLFCALLNGACAFPVDLRQETPNAVAQWLEEAAVTVYHSVPALFRALFAGDSGLQSVRVVRLEGDQASIADVELFRNRFGPDCVLVNGLGTTETGIACQYFMDQGMRTGDTILPVGYAAEDMETLILDENGNPFPETGPVGEIAVTSRFLSPGYWRNPDLTRQAFTRDPRGGPGRMYRTGDVGRLRPDGCLEYLGRVDSRLKIRGQWVSLADVESALHKVKGVREAVVTAGEDGAGEVRLSAYIVPREVPPPTASAIRRSLADTLPPHMIPARYAWMDALPLNTNGKVDRRSLPPPRGRPLLEQDYVAPQSPLQFRISQVWEEILDVRPVGIRDNFFDLGGHSLLAARMVDRLEEVLGRTIPLSILFQAVDVENLADIIFQRSEDLRLPLLKVQPLGSKPPLFFLHGDYNSGGFYCLELARHLGTDQPFYAIPPCGLDGQPVPPSYEEMAELHLQALRAFRPHGPYLLGGTCNGGLVAFEMARRLVASGEKVDLLVLVGASAGNVRFRQIKKTIHAAGILLGLSPAARMELYERASQMVLRLDHLPMHRQIAHVLGMVRKVPRELLHLFRFSEADESGKTGAQRNVPWQETPRELRGRTWETYQQIDRRYIPRKYPNPVTLFWAEKDPVPPEEAARWWRSVSARVDLHVIPGTHLSSLTEDVRTLAGHLKRCLQ